MTLQVSLCRKNNFIHQFICRLSVNICSAVCEILMKYVTHILKTLDKSYWKMQEKIEIISNHNLDKNGHCGRLNFSYDVFRLKCRVDLFISQKLEPILHRKEKLEIFLGSYFTNWSYKFFNPYFLGQPVRIFLNGGKFCKQYVLQEDQYRSKKTSMMDFYSDLKYL